MDFSKMKDKELEGKYISLLAMDGERSVKRIYKVTKEEIFLRGRCIISRETGRIIGAGKWAGIKGVLVSEAKAEKIKERIEAIRKDDPERCTSQFLSKRKYPSMRWDNRR